MKSFRPSPLALALMALTGSALAQAASTDPLAVLNTPTAQAANANLASQPSPVAQPAPVAPVAAPVAPVMNPAPVGAPSSSGGAVSPQVAHIDALTSGQGDESTLLSEVSRAQARLSMLNILSKIEKAKMDMEMDRLRFESEKAKAKADAEKAAGGGSAAPAGVAGVVGGPSPGAPMSTPSAASLRAQAEALDALAPKPSLRGVSSFDGKTFAEIVTPEGERLFLEKGGLLPDGSKLVSIASTSAVVVSKGRKLVLPLSSGASAPAPSAGTPGAVPSGLPPIPSSH